MPSTPAKRRRERSASATSNSSTNSFPDLATLLNTPIKPKPKPKPEASPGKFQKRTFHPISHTQCLTSYLQDCVLGQAYQPSPGMEARIKSFAKEIADDMSDCISEVSETSYKEVVATQLVTINMEIRVTTIAGKETISYTIDPRLSQQIDLEATNAKTKTTDNGNTIKEEDDEESGHMGFSDTSRLEAEKIKEETDDWDDPDVKIES